MKWFFQSLLCFAISASIGAQAVNAQASGELSETEMRGRITEIQTALNEGEGSMRLWWWSWLGLYGAFTAGSFTIAAMADGDTERITYNVSGVQSALGVIGMLISPQAAGYGPSRLRGLPDGNPAQLRARHDEAVSLLDRAADDELMGRSWITHALALVVNGGGALTIWKGYGDRIEDDGGNPRKEAILNFVLGTIISEIQIFTQPTRAIADRDNYRRRHGLQPVSEGPGEVRFFALPAGHGLMLGASVPF